MVAIDTYWPKCEGVRWPGCPRCQSRDVWHGGYCGRYYLHCHTCGLKDEPRSYRASLRWSAESFANAP